MGTGISAVVPIIVAPHDGRWKRDVELEYFSPKFTECYHYDTESRAYTIRHEVLLENYQSFLVEFYDCIGEPCDVKEPPELTSYDAFKEYFDEDARKMRSPFMYYHRGALSFLGGVCPEFWHFYSGSYKAYLETYCTLTHFERILRKAMKNPLVHAIKFGIFG